MKRSFLVLALFSLGFLPGLAINFTQSESILLSPSTNSQTINIGLDGIPKNFIKKDGSVRNGKVRVKFKLDKAAKKLFTVSPQKGRLTIQIKDGIVIPAELTVTAKETAELGSYNYNIVSGKKFRKKAGLENLSSQLQYAETRTITGTLLLPSSSVSELKRNQAVPNIPVQIDVLDLVTGLPLETIATGTTDEFGNFVMELPLDQQLGPQLRCRTSAEAQLNVPDPLDSFVLGPRVLLDPARDFMTDNLLVPELLPVLSDLTLPQLQSFYDLVESVDTSSASSLSEIEQILQAQLDSTIAQLLANADKNPNPFFIPPSFDAFDIHFVLGQAIIGEDPQNPGQELLGQRFSVNINKSKLSAEPNDQVIFTLNGSIVDFDSLDTIFANDNSGAGQEFFLHTSADNVDVTLPAITGVKVNGNCLNFIFAEEAESEDEFSSTKEGGLGDYAYDANERRIHGVDDTRRETDKIGGETFGDFYDSAFRVIEESDGAKDPILDLDIKTYNTTGMNFFIDTNGNLVFEAYAGSCIMNSGDLNCDAKKDRIEVDKQENSAIIETFEYDANDNLVRERSNKKEEPSTDVHYDERDLVFDEVRGLYPSGVEYDGYDRATGGGIVSGSTNNGKEAVVSFFFYEPFVELPQYNLDSFKLYSIGVRADENGIGVTNSKGKAQLETKDGTVEIRIFDDTKSAYDSNFSNSNATNLLPSLSQSSTANASPQAGSAEADLSGVFNYDALYSDSKERCIFPSANYFICQTSSSNIGTSDSGKKELGLIYGVKEE